MAEELSEKLKSLLSNPDTMNMLSSLLGTGSGNSIEKSSDTISESEDAFVSNVKSAISKVNGSSDKRINLLNALRPYMRESRASNIDRAVKMIKLSQLTSLFKDL